VRELALGLLALGRKKGEAVALLSQSRAEWMQADFAILSTGGVTVPIYPTYIPEQIAYIVNDSEARTLIVEDPAQLAKALEVRGKMEGLEQIVVIQGYEGRESAVLTWEELRRLGRENAEKLKSVLADRVAAVRADLSALRRRFHQEPELAFAETRTAAAVAEHLAIPGITLKTGVAGTGVVATIRGARPGRTLLLRADMDALPIREETGAPYASRVAGVMHA